MKNCVYRFLNNENEIIYIGKAKDLKQRFSSHRHLPKECYEETMKIEYCKFYTEYEMDFAERYYIPKFKPKYNTILAEKSIDLSIGEFDSKTWIKFIKSKNKHINIKSKLNVVKKINKCEDYMEKLQQIKDIEYEIKKNTSKIICLTTNEIFTNIKDVENKYKIKNIVKCCENNCSYVGVVNNKPMIWKWYSDYLNMSDCQINNYVDKAYGIFNKKILC